MTQTYKYLHFIKNSIFFLWDPKRLSLSALKYRYNTIPLKDVLSVPKMEWIDIEDDKDYPILGVHAQGEGVYINRIAKGKELTMKQYQRSKPMHLFYCKVRTVNGQWGIVYPEFSNSYGSSNMQYLSISQEKLNPSFLELLLRVKSITQEWDKNAVGADGRHFPLKTLLNLQIPLPSLEEQNKIVAAYNNALAKAEKCVKKSQNIDDQIEAYLQEVLGLSQTKTSTRQSAIGKFMWLVHLKNITRWDVYNSRSNNYDGIYDYVLLRDILVSHPKYGAGYKAEKKQRDVRYIRITDINEDGSLNDDFASVAKYDNQYLLKQDDFLIARTGNTVGKTFLYDESMGKAIYAGYLIKFELDTYKVNPQYLLAYTKSSVYKTWIKNNMRISAQPNINSKQYEESPIILPPLDIQNEIVAHITALRDEQKSLQQQAAELRLQAQKQFEQAIFE